MGKKSIFLKILCYLLLPLSLWSQENISLFHATISAYAIDLETDKVLLDIQSDKSLMPASCMKVATTGAALHILGPEYIFKTNLEIEGEIKEGILQGNVWICGGGDPCLGSDRIAPCLSWDQQVDEWVNAIEERGIKEIRGKVIGDASRWEKAQVAPSWSWEDIGNYLWSWSKRPIVS